MRSATKSLTFPLAGVSRHGPYRQQTRPYSAPWAMNVRTNGPSESRRRGGSRPGLAKYSATDLGQAVTTLAPVTYIDTSGTRRRDLVYVLEDGTVGYMRLGTQYSTTASLDDDGANLTIGGATLDFAASLSSGTVEVAVHAGKVYVSDSTLKTYDPSTGIVDTVIATAGTVPTGENLVASYRNRIVLSGQSHIWYASRVDDPTDWNYGAAIEDPNAPIAGQLSHPGRMGEVVTALAPIRNEALVMATARSLWVYRGGLRTGRLEVVSERVGIISPRAWAVDPDGTLVFLSHDGIYVWSAGSRQAPQRFSEERVPEQLREVSTATNTISMAYDPVERGFHLFVTPSTGAGTHWWIDLTNRAVWPQRFSSNSMQPLAAACLDETGLGDTVVAGSDGYVRYFTDSVSTDDGETLNSHVLIGPVRLAADDVRDGMLAEINAVIESVSGTNATVRWRVVTGKSAAEAAELAKADLDSELAGGTTSSVSGDGTWTEGRNKVSRPRSRGAWVVVWLSSTAAWSYEVVAVVGRQLGRHR